MPIIFGKFKSNEFLRFKKEIENSKFNLIELKSLHFFPTGRWDILTFDNILIKLPLNNLSQSLNLAYKIISDDQFKDQNTVDLRIDEYVIMK